MQKLKIDITKLIKVSNYAKREGVERGTIYARIKAGELKVVDIDGVKFIEIP